MTAQARPFRLAPASPQAGPAHLRARLAEPLAHVRLRCSDGDFLALRRRNTHAVSIVGLNIAASKAGLNSFRPPGLQLRKDAKSDLVNGVR
ncbi:hypothetical protein [Xanthomonas cerealis]|uniref:hypothetical protein n=1 Tax=Xanthomonas cerealis TaxID=3390025 RepID=UPI000A55E080|nr:hypothetical protein [Xanthomonas translucens]